MSLKKFNFFSVFKIIIFIAIICTQSKSFLVEALIAETAQIQGTSDCIYIAPVQKTSEENFLHELIKRGHQSSETFETILNSFEQNKSFYHQFQFKYPLKNHEHAQVFTRVLQIKAQEAHRFVPVIVLSRFISPSHLGFLRRITIDGDGPTIQEHVLTTPTSSAVIFIEEWISTKNGVELGCFAALNRIIEEDGLWYFTGTYLYHDEPSQKEIRDRIEMFTKTYENMLIFSENEDVEKIYQELSKF